ncbi:MAG TPA: sigma-70 family RNA polymerase sigma factor [Candidatus Cryosericum sp.]|nr:sigma-70 family RNA polymerase sigma factor [Candidatus Cryosericum sp.]
MQPDDFAMMEAVRADREGAFESFVERYQRRLYRLALGYLRHHEDALDAVQETMVKIYLARSTYRPVSHPFTWASRILANHCLDQIRRRRARPSESLEATQEAAPGRDLLAGDAKDTPEEYQVRADFRRRVEAAVAALPESQRAVFVLRHFEEMSLEEIAAARGCALGTVKSSLHRAAASVRDQLSREKRTVGEAG